jgi:GDP-4-dehydro-6-deoxy-D-mannose reductase
MLTTRDSRLTTSLITGVNGFVGNYLASHLESHHRRIIGIDLQKESSLSSISYFQVDICDPDALRKVFEETQPDEIFHLAAISHPLQFTNDQFPSFQINMLGAVCLLDAMRNKCPRAKVLMVGSSKQYEIRNESIPITEQALCNPASFYGISKYFAEMIGRRYALNYNLDIRYTRSFNHTGPGQSPRFVCSDWARQIALIDSNGSLPQIFVGNINEVIDFSDVRDVVEAYRLIVEKGGKGEAYNVCSGRGVKLKYILDYLTSKNSTPVSVVVQKAKAEVHFNNKELIGDNRKVQEDTGWSPKITIEKTLDDLYEWWLAEIKDSRVRGEKTV